MEFEKLELVHLRNRLHTWEKRAEADNLLIHLLGTNMIHLRDISVLRDKMMQKRASDLRLMQTLISSLKTDTPIGFGTVTSEPMTSDEIMDHMAFG